MEITFSKYHGTGNDFVMLNNMDGSYDALTVSEIQFLCDRKIGIGADGLIKLSHHNDFDFEMEYYNADGSQSFCGNGARCAMAFAKHLGLIVDDASFMAIDGPHNATVKRNVINIEMLPVKKLQKVNSDYVLDTGSPHYVRIIERNTDLNIIEFGRAIRNSSSYKEKGINVNILTVENKGNINVATYERGVEDETLSCGTGVTACALVYLQTINTEAINYVTVNTRGGVLGVMASPAFGGEGFDNIWLSGEAKHVFDGSCTI